MREDIINSLVKGDFRIDIMENSVDLREDIPSDIWGGLFLSTNTWEFNLPKNLRNICNFESFRRREVKNKKSKYRFLPIYALIHSGISISWSPFSDKWDSGLLGFVVYPKKKYKDHQVMGYCDDFLKSLCSPPIYGELFYKGIKIDDTEGTILFDEDDVVDRLSVEVDNFREVEELNFKISLKLTGNNKDMELRMTQKARMPYELYSIISKNIDLEKFHIGWLDFDSLFSDEYPNYHILLKKECEEGKLSLEIERI